MSILYLKESEDLVTSKAEEYMEYVKNHRDNVRKAFIEIMNNPNIGINSGNTETVSAIINIRDSKKIENHDNSKFSDEEFGHYRRKFYPTPDEDNDDEIEEEFDKACEHHYTVNNHHPEHWVVNGVPNKMSLEAIIEMICDWMAMSYKFGGTAKAWYYDKANFAFHSETRAKVEELLDLIYPEEV